MIRKINTVLTPQQAYDNETTLITAAKIAKVNVNDIQHLQWINRSIDARKYPTKINATFELYIGEQPTQSEFEYKLKNVSKNKQIHIVGAGPAGYFAALELIENGLCPIIFERGKEISARKRDIALLSQNKEVNPESNYAFGEGGAGTFSDGKLYTRSKKKLEVRKVLELFHLHGAQNNILFEAHPHIGTDVLPLVIENIRKTIIKAGGEILFEHNVTDFKFKNNKIEAVVINDSITIEVEELILATGHSAHNIYETLHKLNIPLEAKSFAMGIRLEHPQQIINSIQYHTHKYDPYLPPATYALTQQINGRGVYSFCMCPGGIIVPATTNNKKIVVNGMSNSSRNSPYANSGFAVEIRTEDFEGYGRGGSLSGLDYQANLEKMAFLNGGNGQTAPAQRMYDFVKGRVSGSIQDCSYNPGVISSPVHLWLPEIIGDTLRKGFESLGKRIKGFLTNDGVVVGVESRTSSPVRIPRNKETLNHITIKNMYPCGEGAGYAGGIVSSAIDGICIAQEIAKKTS